MTKAHHPTNRAERKRLAEAKALANPLFRQRKVNAKKRNIKLHLEETEKDNELADYRSDRLEGEHG